MSAGSPGQSSGSGASVSLPGVPLPPAQQTACVQSCSDDVAQNEPDALDADDTDLASSDFALALFTFAGAGPGAPCLVFSFGFSASFTAVFDGADLFSFEFFAPC